MYEDLPETGGWVKTKPLWSRKKRVAIISAAFAVIASIILVASFVWLQRQLNPPGPEGAVVVLDIPQGASINDISRILTSNDVVPNFTVTRFWWRNAGPFQPGTYTFNQNMSLSSARGVLESGPAFNYQTITLPEGLWLTDIEKRLLANLPLFDASELDAALRGNIIRSKYQPEEIDNLEGLLFPSTYQIDDAGASDEFGFVKRLVDQFDLVLDDLNYAESEARLGYTPYEVVIVASIVEEEARVDEDRAKIARVIYNRLASNMRLEVDATVVYALGEHKSQLTQSDLEIDSPYNTRRNRGLPPTPISAPSRKSLEAALNPADGDWLFFVLADEDGTHFFTSDYDAFLTQVAKSREEGLF